MNGDINDGAGSAENSAGDRIKVMEQSGAFVLARFQIHIQRRCLNFAADRNGVGGVDDLLGIIADKLHALRIEIDGFIIAIGNPLLLFC